jgi:hypothetical protein
MHDYYLSLTKHFPEAFDTKHAVYVNIPVGTSITLYRNYMELHRYLLVPPVNHDASDFVEAVREDVYYLNSMGNKGFKQSYIQVYPDYQTHKKHGRYVAWMVHV